jgi:hypothetical protein
VAHEHGLSRACPCKTDAAARLTAAPAGATIVPPP